MVSQLHELSCWQLFSLSFWMHALFKKRLTSEKNNWCIPPITPPPLISAMEISKYNLYVHTCLHISYTTTWYTWCYQRWLVMLSIYTVQKAACQHDKVLNPYCTYPFYQHAWSIFIINRHLQQRACMFTTQQVSLLRNTGGIVFCEVHMRIYNYFSVICALMLKIKIPYNNLPYIL